jgi:hypothetical protein
VVIAFKNGTDSGFFDTARRQTDSLGATLLDDAEA